MAKTAGYSGTPLAKKLGIKEGHVLTVFHAPENYFALFDDLPADLVINPVRSVKKNVIHYFVRHEASLRIDLPTLKKEIVPDGCIWVSWPKKSSKVETDITEDVVRNYALKIGLVDIKVCAVDETWSGLKLVIPVKERKNN